jgi:hypothetical protein
MSTLNLTQDAFNPKVVTGFQLLHANYKTVHQLMQWQHPSTFLPNQYS